MTSDDVDGPHRKGEKERHAEDRGERADRQFGGPDHRSRNEISEDDQRRAAEATSGRRNRKSRCRITAG
jgi:hypothetical protein